MFKSFAIREHLFKPDQIGISKEIWHSSHYDDILGCILFHIFIIKLLFKTYYTPGYQFFTISKTEYRLKFQSTVLVLIRFRYHKISKH
jgi:hypothetical protein